VNTLAAPYSTKTVDVLRNHSVARVTPSPRDKEGKTEFAGRVARKKQFLSLKGGAECIGPLGEEKNQTTERAALR